MSSEDKQQRIADYRSFISQYLDLNCDLYSCTHVQCCRKFGHDGPRINNDEKQAVVEAIKAQGLEDIADYVKRHDAIPTTQDEPVSRECKLLDQDKGCLLHYSQKPSVCVEYPVFISESEDSIRIDIDLYCNLIASSNLLRDRERLLREFETRFGKRLDLRLGNSLEDKMHIYYDEER